MKKPSQHILLWLGLFGLAVIALSISGLAPSFASASSADAAEAMATPALVHEGALLRVAQASPLAKALAVAPVASESVAAPMLLPAVVEADPAHLVKITTPLAARVVSLRKQLGDAVQAGEVLLVIDAPDFAQASADAAKAQAALTLAGRSLARQRELDQAELSARRDLEQAQSDYDQAASEAARASARLRQAGAQGNVKDGAVDGKLAVRSPIAGRVVELAAAQGAYWNDASAPLMTVADLSTVFVSVHAQEKDLSQVYAGQAASVKFDAYAAPLSGQVRYVGDMLDADTRTVKLRIPLANRDGRLKPGMFAVATLQGRTHTAIVAPMTAIVQSGFASRVFVETRPWVFAAREVRLGAQNGEQVEVLAGLKEGERIVVKGGVLLND